ncbi:uncharacterized protein LOC122921252 [Bufo gargarizans]|uniref:uncharacterized protein LOC122921252 n=1 Tax=Bufo gargarizans TaxID=30331 RepID=UPI001CF37F06|nr:uncharacterized protein LOC122921252 [Bufo gargarizans]
MSVLLCYAPPLSSGDADVAMDSGRNSDYVERLASKYMRKCKVESSTDSESDNNNNEGLGINMSIAASPVDIKTMDFQKLQFLDPYDGDSEDTLQSNSSECEQTCISDDPQNPCPLGEGSVGMDCGLVSISDPPCEGWSLTSCSDRLEKVKTSWQSLDISKKSSVPSGSSDLSMDSGTVTEDASVASGRFLLIGLASRSETSTVLPASLTSEETSDFSMFESSLIKRKGGIRMEGEKLRLKKLRVAEYMVGGMF